MTSKIKMAPDFTAEIPFWSNEGMMEWSELEIGESLRESITAWNQIFLSSFNYEDGWENPDVARNWRERGIELFAMLNAQLSGKYVLEIDLWPAKGLNDC